MFQARKYYIGLAFEFRDHVVAFLSQDQVFQVCSHLWLIDVYTATWCVTSVGCRTLMIPARAGFVGQTPQEIRIRPAQVGRLRMIYDVTTYLTSPLAIRTPTGTQPLVI
jgi:hypothetical protein